MNLSQPSAQTVNTKEGVSSGPPIILASQSPQRKQLLEQLGFTLHCHPVHTDETPLPGELPKDLVVRLALAKAERCYEMQIAKGTNKEAGGGVIIGADTTIDLDDASLGKPTGESDAIDMLQRLADREHLVHTGICVVDLSNGKLTTQRVTTIVRFGAISKVQAQQYWDSGEPLGKAGAYAIQGLGAQFVAHLSGSYTNVVGLPLYETLQLIRNVC